MPAVIIRGQPIKTTVQAAGLAGTQATVTVGGGGTEVLAAPVEAYTYVLLQNVGSNDVYLDLVGGTPTVGNGFLLAGSGGSLELAVWASGSAINGIADGISSDVEVLSVGS